MNWYKRAEPNDKQDNLVTYTGENETIGKNNNAVILILLFYVALTS